MSATTACLCIAATYVAPLYLWADGPRNAPGTILRRMAATLACCCVAWIPLWLSMPHVRTAARASSLPAPHSHGSGGHCSGNTARTLSEAHRHDKTMNYRLRVSTALATSLHLSEGAYHLQSSLTHRHACGMPANHVHLARRAAAARRCCGCWASGPTLSRWQRCRRWAPQRRCTRARCSWRCSTMIPRRTRRAGHLGRLLHGSCWHGPRRRHAHCNRQGLQGGHDQHGGGIAAGLSW